MRQHSAQRVWPLLAWGRRFDDTLARWADGSRSRVFLHEFLRFGLKQGWACLFGGLMLGLLFLTHLLYPKDASLARYDFLVITACLIQVAMLAFKLETLEEAKVILLFHVVGTVMEVFKTSMGSWAYPEPSLLRIGGVPLFSGFMYAAVGSYIARAWRLFEFRFTAHPPLWALFLLSVGIYTNFFSHHYLPDMRYALFLVTAWLFRSCWVHYRIRFRYRKMPLLLGFVLVALFIFFAENIATFSSAWLYPNQMKGWAPVSWSKLGSWLLLMIISYVMVASVNHPEEMRE